ncbi:MAG: DUF1127 domain-containing protein [Paracoccaceae bacterium]|nr:DUF1127 domain-containing protein [Paracoccaceae bacterium]
MIQNTTHNARTGHPLHQLSVSLAERIRQYRRRRGFRRLLDLDDHMLRDIGVTHAEVEIASNLPLSVDAGQELRRMSLERRRRYM